MSRQYVIDEADATVVRHALGVLRVMCQHKNEYECEAQLDAILATLAPRPDDPETFRVCIKCRRSMDAGTLRECEGRAKSNRPTWVCWGCGDRVVRET